MQLALTTYYVLPLLYKAVGCRFGFLLILIPEIVHVKVSLGKAGRKLA